MKKAETYPHELSSIQKEIASIENTFFTHLSQEEVIVLLDLLAEKNDILLNEILFDKNSTSTSAITNIPLDAVTISLLVTGTYDNCLLFIQSIEGLANNLTLTNFEMGIQADSSLQLKLNLLFYSWAYADEQTD
ncbi:hypothetical protein JR334_08745 [Clostridia bacterium]|nr:hypothetical protein JR334_08745 [Clostridia bacterium]